MKTMTALIISCIATALILGIAWYVWQQIPTASGPATSSAPTPMASAPTPSSSPAYNDLIELDSPKPGASITSPLKVTGRARGTWFFEATFPVILTNWDGEIIAEGFATAEGEWMTENYVPFSADLHFRQPDYGKQGTLILKKANASGLPENDDALEITVSFE
jgi:hypothetical protein